MKRVTSVHHLEPFPEIIDEVPTGERLLRAFLSETVSRIPMDPDTKGGRILGGVAPGKEASDEAGQNVSAPTLGKAWATGGVFKDGSACREYPRVITLHHEGAASEHTQLPGHFDPVIVRGVWQ